MYRLFKTGPEETTLLWNQNTDVFIIHCQAILVLSQSSITYKLFLIFLRAIQPFRTMHCFLNLKKKKNTFEVYNILGYYL